MSSSHPRRSRAAIAATALAAVAVGGLAPTASAAPADTWPLVVTEIVPDNTGYDHFEYFEVTNPTATDVTVGEDGYGLAYTYVDSADTARDVALSAPTGTIVPAGGTVVFWLSYTNDTVDSFAYDEADFRSFWAARGGSGEDYDVVRVEGQSGMANGGERGIRVTGPDGEIVGWSYYPGGSTGVDEAAQFRIPADPAERSMDLLAGNAAPSPGVVEAAQLEDREPEEPTEPDEPAGPIPGPAPDSLVGTLLLTELVVDSTNVGGADGYEFIEVYNTTTEPVEFGDYQIRYLYPDSGSSALWPATPAEATIPPGGTIVLWIKNGQNDHLDRGDFNDFWGTSVPEERILEIFAGGMANGSARGVEIATDTGVTVNGGFYNIGGARDVAVDQGIAYGVDPEDFSRQRIIATRAATPGTVEPDQVPTELTATTPDTTAPVVADTTATSIDPAQDFTVSATITDDVLVRSVTLELRSNLEDEFARHDLLVGEDDTYRHTIAAVDLTGKRYYEYRFVASDGTNRTVTEAVRVEVEGVDTSPVRLGVTDGDVLSGTAVVSAAGEDYPAELALSIDGQERTPTTPQLETAPVFAVEVTATDDYFRNAVLLPGEGESVNDRCESGRVLTIFDEGTYSDVETVTAEVPLEAVTQGEELTLLVSAGTKAWPCEDDDENNDDYSMSNPRLILPDGRTLQPAGYTGGNLAMGDSNDGQYDNYPAVFTIPDDAFTALGYAWDTTTAEDGEHTVRATDGQDEASAVVVVDNTAPVVEPVLAADSVRDSLLQGEITLDATVTDATSDVADVVATLDGEVVELPHTTSSTSLAAGEHVLAVTATDVAGNVAEVSETFTTPQEDPSIELLTPQDGATVAGTHVPLTARVTDPAEDDLDVVFRGAYAYGPTDAEVSASAGTTRDALAVERDAAELSEDELAALATLDGETATVRSDDALPYQRFDVAVPEASGADASVRVAWDGTADARAKVLLHVWNAADQAWEEVDRHLAVDGQAFTLDAEVPVTDRLVEGEMRFLVQHSEGWAGPNTSDRSSVLEPAHPEDTPRSEYDFTLAWESDTQYYNEEFYEHQLAIHQYLLDQREDLNLHYLFHTGDIVDDHDQPYQWENADAAYRMLDDAGLPYGVLAGNHDVGNFANDYSVYREYFGEDRFAANPWYGGSYEDNRGHYDLFTAGGIDFLVVSMGWDPGDEAIAWMNEVLAQYPERVAIINLHEYLLTTGGLGPIPQRIQDEVVASNPNVSMVMSGHYHDAHTRYDSFDDDGDGVAERTVTQMLFDYQGLPEGGQGFLRLLHFDNESEEIRVRTYSPSLEQYDAEHPTLEPENQDFVISYETAGILSQVKELHADAFRAEVLTDVEIGEPEDGDRSADRGALGASTSVPSGSTVTAEWTPSDGTYGWYVVATDAFGGQTRSEVREVTFVATEDPSDPEPTDPPTNGDGDGDGDGAGGDDGDGAGDGARPGGSGSLPSTGAPTGLLVAVLLGLLAAGVTLVVTRQGVAQR